MTFDCINRPSANFGDRQPVIGSTGINMLVIHYTGMVSCAAALDSLCDPAAKVSANLLIREDGEIYRLVADECRAWHAGQAYWRGITDINSASIGIELANPGHEFCYQPFPEAQISALIAVSQDLIERYSIPATGVVGHSDIAPSRKCDPGELFPWQALAKAGIVLWPTQEARSFDPRMSLDELAAIGYAKPGDPEQGGDFLDPETAEADVIIAFQRRFLPTHLTGVLDEETPQTIAAVARTFS